MSAPGAVSTIPEHAVEQPFHNVLQSSRVYTRAPRREGDGTNSMLTSHSVLTGLSLADIAQVSGINLPLSDEELRRFDALTSDPVAAALLPGNSGPRISGGALQRMSLQLRDIERDPPANCSAGRIGEDMVEFNSPFNLVPPAQADTLNSSTGKAAS